MNWLRHVARLPLKWRVGISAALSLLAVGTAVAATGPYGRDWLTGYFVGNPASFINWVFVSKGATLYPGLGPNCDVSCNVTLASFIKVYHDRLNDATAQGIINRGRAAAEIDIMLGRQGTDFPTIQSGIDYAQANFQEWINLITLYANGTIPGYTVNWNDMVNFSFADSNGMGMYNIKGAGPGTTMTCFATQQCVGNISFTNNFNDSGVDDSVVFFRPGGKRFIIKHKCANLTGDFTNLTIPPSQIDLAKSSTQPIIPIGAQMNYDITAHEAEPIPLTNVTITDTIPAQFQYVGPAPGFPAPTRVVGNTVTWTFNSPADNAILNTITNGSQSLSVIVKAITAGTNIINTAGGPGSTATDEFGQTVTVNPGRTSNTIVPNSFPAVVGANSDVHAGGGICNLSSTSGFIEGNFNSDSGDQYVVSTNGSITNFGSNGAASGSATDNLDIGKNGAYASVCRPDLYQFAQTNRNASTMPFIGPAVNLSTLTAGTYFVAGNATVFGTVNHKITLVVSGNVTITGQINIETGTNYPGHSVASAEGVPSFGLIAHGSISIDSGVTLVEAYLFSDSSINTCLVAGPSCNTTLTVNGFLMGNTLEFRRLGPLNAAGASVGEQINLNPQLYLNPPTFFDATVDQAELNGQGERQPLF